MTPKQIESYKRWHNRTVKKCKNCGDQCLVIEQKEHFADVSKKIEQKESAFVHNKIEFPEYNDGLLEEFDKQFFENGQDDILTETALEQKDVK